MSAETLVRFADVGAARRSWDVRVHGPVPARSALLASLAGSGALPRALAFDVRWLPGHEGRRGVVVVAGQVVGRFACLPAEG